MSAATPPVQTPPSGAPAGRRRKLHSGHFAFMRALVQGLDASASWERYLRIEGDAGDRRAVRSTIGWMRDEFAAAARREQRHGTERFARASTHWLRHTHAWHSIASGTPVEIARQNLGHASLATTTTTTVYVTTEEKRRMRAMVGFWNG